LPLVLLQATAPNASVNISARPSKPIPNLWFIDVISSSSTNCDYSDWRSG
jgi:hypothetical protein